MKTQANLLRDWLPTLPNDNTRRAYAQGIHALAVFLHAPSDEAAARRVLRGGRIAANDLAVRFRAHLLRRELAPASVNNRLMALRALCAWARRKGLIEWPLEFSRVKHQILRDTRGPEPASMRRLFAHLERDRTVLGLRNLAMVRLMAHRGLRRGEVASLDVESFDGDRVFVAGKGRSGERTPLTIAPSTRDAVARWLRARPAFDPPGSALFVHENGARFSEESIGRMVRAAGRAVGLKRLTAHMLRHYAGTEAYRRTKDIRAVQVFMRHSSLDVTAIYVQQAEDPGGRLARVLGRER